MKFYLVYKNNGLYDPVLDDYEPLYEPIEPEGSDQPSFPTEVQFEIHNFTETPPIPESRSLTASPFQLPTKPYRPFSTEPIPIPPLEEPIILNPNYCDDFGNFKFEEEIPPETKFKLPISDQYDPDGTRRQKLLESKKQTEEEKMIKEIDTKEERMIKDEVKYMEEMKKEIDLEKIEKTATSLVDESLEKAISVTEEIKKEIEVEMDTKLNSDIKKEEIVKESKIDISEKKEYEKNFTTRTHKKESKKEVQELVEFIDKTTDVILKQSDSKLNETVAEQLKKFETIEKEDKVLEERRLSTKQEIEESIVAGSVKKKSMIFEKPPVVETLKTERERSVDISIKQDKREIDQRIAKNVEAQRTERIITNGVKSTPKSEATQRSFTIGLQTIPNIKGSACMSYHQEMLLKTFFIHLTDVMVALSRFILMEPVKKFDRERHLIRDFAYESVREESIRKENDREQKAEERIIELKTQKVEDRSKEELMSKADNLTREKVLEIKHVENKDNTINNHVEKQVINDIKHEFSEDIRDKLAVEAETEVQKRKLSGARMAQLSEKKSEELTHKMEAVISEFQNKAGIDTESKEIVIQRGRSRSRSQIEEEVARESDPLEWLAKVDSGRASAEITEITSNKKEFSNFYETKTSKKIDTKHETRSFKTITPIEGKNTYVAIVEAHVYTNKDAIFEEHLEDMSEISIQSAEETKIAHQVSEATVFENVALDSSAMMKEQAKSLIEKSHELKTASKESTVQYVKETDMKMVEMKVEEKKIDLDVKKIQAKETINAIEPVEVQEVVKSEMVEEFKAKYEEMLAVAEMKEVSELEKNEVKVHKIEVIEPRIEIQEIKKCEIIEEISMKEESVGIVTEVADVIEIQEVVKSEMVEEFKAKNEEKLAVAEMKEVSELEKNEVKVHKIEVIEPRIEIKEIKKCEIIEEIFMTEESVGIVTEVAEVAEVKQEQTVQIQEITEKEQEIDVSVEASIKTVQQKEKKEPKEEFAELKITKEEVIEVETEYMQLGEDFEVSLMKDATITEGEVDSCESVVRKVEETSFKKSLQWQEEQRNTELENESQELFHETSHIEAIKSSALKELSTTTELTQENKSSTPSEPSTPSTVPATPLVDEYVFRLDIPLPKTRSTTPKPHKLEPDSDTQHDEDPHIVKKQLVPCVDTSVEVNDQPAPSPASRPRPVYIKPGLRGGGDREELTKEEIMEIGRKSSLLASAIDETIKSIEEYKEEVGIESKKEIKVQRMSKTEFVATKSSKFEEQITKEVTDKPVIYNGYSKVIENKVYDAETVQNNKEEDITSNREVKIIKKNNDVSKDSVAVSAKETLEKEESKAQNGIEVIQFEDRSTKNENVEIKMEIKEESTGIEKSEEKQMERKSIEESSMKMDVAIEETSEKREFTQNLEEGNINGNFNQDIAEIIESKSETEVNENASEISAIKKSETVTKMKEETDTRDPLKGYKPVHFDPEEIQKKLRESSMDFQLQETVENEEPKPAVYVTDSGEVIGTIQGIVDGLEEAVVDEEVAKELGKPGMPEERIAEIISGEAEMLREAHVMGLSRVLNSHMHRVNDDDDSSIDFKKIKPLVESLKDSEVLKALNEEEIEKAKEKKKKEERKWTTFLQKPKKPVPKARYGYYGYIEQEVKEIEEPYKVKIVKQPKPKVAPDYKPEDFDTGPLPWEERAQTEQLTPAAPIEPEEPILIPEEVPQFLEAVDPLPESEVPDLEDTGIQLPPEQPTEERPSPVPEITVEQAEEEPVEVNTEEVIEETERIVEDMEQERLAEQLMKSVQSLVDPNGSVEQQLTQMRAQLAALAQLPGVIQQTLELVMMRISQLSQQEAQKTTLQSQINENADNIEVVQNSNETVQEQAEEPQQTKPEQNGINTEDKDIEEMEEKVYNTKDSRTEENEESKQTNLTEDEMQQTKKKEEMSEEEMKIEKQKKEMERIEYEGRQVKQRPTPRVGKPKPAPAFGPLNPQVRPVILPGGRRWRRPQDVYDEQFIAETLNANAEIINGKAKGINFMKYEKPPVSLDHLQHSDVYKLIHNMEQSPMKRVELLTPVIAESDYREKCRSVTPCVDRVSKEEHQNIPEQVQP